jgi:hypothetical protein
VEGQIMQMAAEAPPAAAKVVEHEIRGEEALVTIEGPKMEDVVGTTGRLVAYRHRNGIGFSSAGIVPTGDVVCCRKGGDGTPLTRAEQVDLSRSPQDVVYRNTWRLVRSPI